MTHVHKYTYIHTYKHAHTHKYTHTHTHIYIDKTKLSSATALMGAKDDGAYIRLRDRGPWGAKHMSRLDGQPHPGPPVFSSQACLVLNFIDLLKG